MGFENLWFLIKTDTTSYTVKIKKGYIKCNLFSNYFVFN